MNIPLEQDRYYHIYNRANGNDKIFVEKDNYRFFMEKYRQHISPIADTYCYCLMPNHFHFLIKVKTEKEVREALVGKQNGSGFDAGEPHVPGFENLGRVSVENPSRFDGWPLEKILSKQLSNFFNSYAKAFNKQQNRMGSLFIKNFKRKKIEDMTYMKNLIRYIHNNPVEAGMVRAPEHFNHSSYNAILNDDNSFVKSSEMLEWYYNQEGFILIHNEK